MLSDGLINIFNNLAVEVSTEQKGIHRCKVTVGDLLCTLNNITDGGSVMLELRQI